MYWLQVKKKNDLLLQGKDGGDTTINWIRQPCLSLIRYGCCRFVAAVRRNVGQELWHIASPKHLVHSCKLSCTLISTKVGCKNASPNALPPQELASPTWCCGWRSHYCFILCLCYQATLGNSASTLASRSTTVTTNTTLWLGHANS